MTQSQLAVWLTAPCSVQQCQIEAMPIFLKGAAQFGASAACCLQETACFSTCVPAFRPGCLPRCAPALCVRRHGMRIWNGFGGRHCIADIPWCWQCQSVGARQGWRRWHCSNCMDVSLYETSCQASAKELGHTSLRRGHDDMSDVGHSEHCRIGTAS